MRRIRRNSKECKHILSLVKDVTCYTLGNQFRGEVLKDGDPQLTRSPRETLRRELAEGASLTEQNGGFTAHVHSNLWFSFKIDETPVQQAIRSTPDAVCNDCGRKIWLQKGTNKFVAHGPGKDDSFTCKGSGMETR